MQFKYGNHSKSPGIYKITNTYTNRIYIGQAKCFKDRWHDYKSNLPLNKGHNKYLLNDFNQCFKELNHTDFLIFEVVEVMNNSTKEERNLKEEYYISLYYDKQDKCYNFRETMGIRTTYSSTPEQTSQKLSESIKNRMSTEDGKKQVEDALKKGYDFWQTEEGKQLKSQQTKEMWQTEEHRNKIKTAQESEEYQKRQRESHQELWKDEEYRRKQMEYRTSDEYKDLMRENNKSLWTDEYRIKMSEMAKQQRLDNPDYQKNLTDKSAEKRAKPYKLIGPNNEVVEGKNIAEFCRKYGLSETSMGKIISGKYVEHKGWKLFREDGNYPEKPKKGPKVPLTGENHPMYGKTKENHPRYGIILSEEHKSKIAKSNSKYYNVWLINEDTNEKVFISNNLAQFAREKNIDNGKIYLVIKKQRKSHKGWRLLKEEEMIQTETDSKE